MAQPLSLTPRWRRGLLRIALTVDSATSICGVAPCRPEFRRQICLSDLKGALRLPPIMPPNHLRAHEQPEADTRALMLKACRMQKKRPEGRFKKRHPGCVTANRTAHLARVLLT